MRVHRILSSAAIAGLVLACTEQGDPLTAPTALSPDPLLSLHSGSREASVNGQATTGGGIQTTAFHALRAPDGTVSGTFESKNRGQACGGTTSDPDCHVRVHAALDCLVVTRNEAVFGGLITHAEVGAKVGSVPGLAVGQRLWAKVRDNGEGAGAEPDEFSDWFIDIGGLGGTPTTITACAPNPVVEFPGFIPGLLPIDRGDIQVR